MAKRGMSFCAWIIGALAVLLFRVAPANSTQYDPVFDPDYLRGVEKLIVISQYGTFTRQLPSPADATGPNIFLMTVQEIFADTDVKVTSQLQPFDDKQPSVLMVEFTISTRLDSLAGKPVDVGAISLQIWRRGRGVTGVGKPVGVVSYPFVIAEDAEAMRKTIATAIHHLADHLPAYWLCGNSTEEKARSAACGHPHLKPPYASAPVFVPTLKRN
jgi:hypothetical protein